MEDEIRRTHDAVRQLSLQVAESNGRQDERLRSLESMVLRQDALLQALWQQQVEFKNMLRMTELVRQQSDTYNALQASQRDLLNQLNAIPSVSLPNNQPQQFTAQPQQSYNSQQQQQPGFVNAPSRQQSYTASSQQSYNSQQSAPVQQQSYNSSSSSSSYNAPAQPSSYASQPSYISNNVQQPQTPSGLEHRQSFSGASGRAEAGFTYAVSPAVSKRSPRPTVVPHKNFSAEKDAQILHKAMKGFGTDERRIVEILGHRSAHQRNAIAEAYFQAYKKKLTDALSSELSNNLKALVLALMTPPAAFDASEVRNAIKGAGTDDATLIEVLCGRTNEQIRDLKEAYKNQFKRDIVQDVTDDTSGDYRKLLLEILKGQREPEAPVNEANAKEDASLLYKAGEGKTGTDEDTFIKILTTRSHAHLTSMMNHYQKLSDYDIERAIKKEMSANLKRALITICQFARNPWEYFAQRLEVMMKGLGTNDRGLIRIIVTRCEIDLANIKVEYSNLFKRTLEAAIKSETSGDYRHLLNALIASDDQQFNAENDAKSLRRAMKGIGTDNDKLIQILGTRSNDQRQQINAAYKSAFQRTLREELKKETSGDFAKLLDCMMLTPAQFDAWTVQRCVKGLGTDDDTLIEVLCTRTNGDIRAMIEEYKTQFNSDLVNDVRSDTSGDYQMLLLGLLAAQRDESTQVNPALAKEDASNLYKAGEGKIGTDEKMFIDILTRRNFYHLRAVCDEYDQMCDYSLEQSIRRETSFNFKKALVAIVRCVRNPAEYFAERLQLSMKGAGTNDLQLIRVTITRAELDLAEIREVYQKKYKMTLEKAIENDTSGNYRRLLIKLVEFAAGIAPMAF